MPHMLYFVGMAPKAVNATTTTKTMIKTITSRPRQ